jgi:hypothetical protein
LSTFQPEGDVLKRDAAHRRRPRSSAGIASVSVPVEMISPGTQRQIVRQAAPPLPATLVAVHKSEQSDAPKF